MTVTASDVQKIYPTSLDVSAFLEIAQNFADELLSGKGLSEDTLDSIVIYLTAHLLVLTEEGGGLRRQKMGDSDESYRVPGDKETGFSQTRFGQMAMILDPTGTLAGIGANNGLKAKFEIVGNGTNGNCSST